MRQIGTIADETDARTFADHLLTLGITTRLDPRDDGWAVWVHKEDLVAQAGRELAEFRQDPRATRYQGVGQQAREIRRQAEKAERLHQTNTIDLRGRLGPMAVARGPVTRILIVLSVAVTLLTDFGDRGEPLVHRLVLTRPYLDADRVLHLDALELIRRGEVWRLVTPIFLHFNVVHLLFNMFALNDLGSLIETRRGSRRLALLVLATGVGSNLAQYLAPDLFTAHPFREGFSFFGGMSGVIFGLFGYAWMRGRFDLGSGLALAPGTVSYMLFWMLLCMTGLLGPIANTAHAVGLLAGMLCGVAPYWRRRYFG
jgi:GlpG protein